MLRPACIYQNSFARNKFARKIRGVNGTSVGTNDNRFQVGQRGERELG
jgi:hypothetical protein